MQKEAQQYNQLQTITHLRNIFYIMRHGESTANQQGVVVSSAENGVTQFGLSDLGEQQALSAIKNNQPFSSSTLVVTSDFLRAKQTAEIVHQHLNCNHSLQVDIRLRERNFGSFELGTSDCYEIVWQADKSDPHHTNNQVESAAMVTQRVSALILELDQQYEQQQIILVAHGDVLQLLATAFAKQPASSHRQIPHLENAEIRALQLF